MQYFILTEDRQDCSGYIFYDMLNKQFLRNKFEVLSVGTILSDVTKGGNTYLCDALTLLVKRHKKEECSIFVAYDNQIITSNISERRKQDMININYNLVNTIESLQSRSVHIYLFDYICFEELFLMLPNIEYELGGEYFKYNKQTINKLDILRKCINDNNFENPKLLSLFNKESNTVESLCADILTGITTCDSLRSFRIEKGSIGPCWLNDCSVNIKESVNNRVCYDCKMRNNYGEVVVKRNKKLFIERKSLMLTLILFLRGL